MKKMTFAATGDSFIVRRIPDLMERSGDLVELIKSADAAFTNLETVLRTPEQGFPSAQSGGTWASSPPEVLRDILDYGFNLTTWANNHTLDYSYGGLESTYNYLDDYGLTHAGVGFDLADAARPRYLDTKSGRVALIGATSSFHESWMAGERRVDGPGRPGVNHLRHSTINHATAEQLRQLREIAEACGINRQRELSVKEGFTVADAEGVVRFGESVFSLAAEPGRTSTSTVNKVDEARVCKAIREAARMADIVLVSVHSHQFERDRKDLPSEFLKKFARVCIDAGAHAIIGHGPHILRGVEIYKRRPIFYSLGNFIFHNESVSWLPADFYEKYGLDAELEVSELLDYRSGNGKRGLRANPKVWHSVVARWEMSGGVLSDLRLHPVELGFDQPVYGMGNPQLCEGVEALEEIRDLSLPFGTEFELREGVAVWKG